MSQSIPKLQGESHDVAHVQLRNVQSWSDFGQRSEEIRAVFRADLDATYAAIRAIDPSFLPGEFSEDHTFMSFMSFLPTETELDPRVREIMLHMWRVWGAFMNKMESRFCSQPDYEMDRIGYTQANEAWDELHAAWGDEPGVYVCTLCPM